ncbi:hypothetical protein RND71_005649 [Anisodus tanguticus]|uniref:Uncharacterized protein n=1 Tax=Anisodus tanguticus TaxID=243964 RepID=A0AAE1STI4_9SOLA|nr:hypothetical protein RND71_005649 [Anisodus tanguticus]
MRERPVESEDEGKNPRGRASDGLLSFISTPNRTLELLHYLCIYIDPRLEKNLGKAISRKGTNDQLGELGLLSEQPQKKDRVLQLLSHYVGQLDKDPEWVEFIGRRLQTQGLSPGEYKVMRTGQMQQSDVLGVGSPLEGGQETVISRNITTYRKYQRDLGKQTDLLAGQSQRSYRPANRRRTIMVSALSTPKDFFLLKVGVRYAARTGQDATLITSGGNILLDQSLKQGSEQDRGNLASDKVEANIGIAGKGRASAKILTYLETRFAAPRYLLDSDFVPTTAICEVLIVFLLVLLPAGIRKKSRASFQDRRKSKSGRVARFHLCNGFTRLNLFLFDPSVGVPEHEGMDFHSLDRLIYVFSASSYCFKICT